MISSEIETNFCQYCRAPISHGCNCGHVVFEYQREQLKNRDLDWNLAMYDFVDNLNIIFSLSDNRTWELDYIDDHNTFHFITDYATNKSYGICRACKLMGKYTLINGGRVLGGKLGIICLGHKQYDLVHVVKNETRRKQYEIRRIQLHPKQRKLAKYW